MDDRRIIDLFLARSEQTVEELDRKYGAQSQSYLRPSVPSPRETAQITDQGGLYGMNRELLSKAFVDIGERIVSEAYRHVPEETPGASERTVQRKWKRITTLALAAALALAPGITAYAAWSIHAVRH